MKSATDWPATAIQRKLLRVRSRTRPRADGDSSAARRGQKRAHPRTFSASSTGRIDSFIRETIRLFTTLFALVYQWAHAPHTSGPDSLYCCARLHGRGRALVRDKAKCGAPCGDSRHATNRRPIFADGPERTTENRCRLPRPLDVRLFR